MKQSRLFTKTRKEAPADEVSKNAQLLIRAGYVHKEMAGVYSYLSLGIRVLEKIEKIVREEMNSIGGQEIRMATLHPSEPWKQTGAWDSVDVVFKILSRTEKEYTVGQSEEEIVTPIVQEYALSYKDLPLAVYQIGQKYRDELRAKSGIMRGREFSMKDMYSFHESQEDFDLFYNRAKEAYFRVYERCGLVAKATEASGGSFTKKLSYEFMVLTDAGEDDILYCDTCSYCANVEITKENEGDACTRCDGSGKLMRAKASEVGNIFDLGTKYTNDFNFTYKDKEGNEKYPIMGCFGIGITRLMGVSVEAFSDEKGIVWPESIAPFRIHLVELSGGDTELKDEADGLYNTLKEAGVEVLYDDRDVRAGEKFNDSDLLGLPHRIVVSKKTKEEGKFEVVERKTGEVAFLTEEELYQKFLNRNE
ncbi:MAG: His/Gly/Thr/Pro-type tRNA ligase C-terminal domain-containing protein [Candidatus Kaiserbacteria bacterium]|nr:His/Gly/Thr/Pro-type tRNA ligase C-terminal domain-containing protein [Candidatus Kaiserbacteria bacterium]